MDNRYYVVKRGDSLWGIARHFGYSVEELAACNGLSGRQKKVIKVGQKINLPGKKAGPDLLLSVRLIGLNSAPIKHANLELFHDGKITEVQTDEAGWLHDLDIQDHAKGLKIEFENYDGKWRSIFEEKSLPLGEKVLQINILTDLVKGQTLRKDGSTIVPDQRTGGEVKRQTPQPAAPSVPGKPLPDIPAVPVVMNTRTSDGSPTTINAPLFAGENLYLNKGNEKFRQAIVDASKRYNLTPHALAAIINAEAAKTKNGTWIETCAAAGSSARGLGQFLPAAWFQYIAKPATMGNAEAIKLTGANTLLAANNTLYQVNDQRKTEVSASMQKLILSWRDNGGYSIDAIGAYADDNLLYLKKQGIDATGLPPDEKVKIAYIMHHEGPMNGMLYLSGKLGRTVDSPPNKIRIKLASQLKTKKDDGTAMAKAIADRFDGDYAKAYYYFLANHTDTMVRAKNFMLKHEGFHERSVYEVVQSVSNVIIDKPKEIITPPVSHSTSAVAGIPANEDKEVGPAEGVGGVTAWADPLDRCAIRIGGYSDSESDPHSARSKSLFGGRGGKHKGIDLCAVPGTPIKAVANGEIHFAGAGGTYGSVILLKVDINDLPPAQKHYALSMPSIAHETIYFMYAHLSAIDISKNDLVKAGEIIGKSGCSGNAHKMTEVGPYSEEKYGAHLHFEVRRSPSLKKGDGMWFDPKPFLNTSN